jgi:6-pyruvoyltetrahydropterin/6-carboxytetrahydropterin synthase
MTTVTRCYHFSASHRLHCDQLSPAENARIFGKCNNPFGHGHDYTLEVTVAGSVDAETGLILAVADLDHLVSEQILSVFASRNINVEVAQFATLVPTTENIAAVIADTLQRKWSDYLGDSTARLVRVHVQETARNGFEVLIAQEESLNIHA